MNILDALHIHHGVQPVDTVIAQLPAATPTHQESSMSFLASVGNFFRKALHIGEVAATVAEPIVLTAFPDIAPLYTSAIGLAISAESSAAAATGTGPQKLANVVTSLTPMAEKFFAQNGIQMDQAALAKWTSAVVDTLNLIPAPTAAKQ